MLVIAEAATAPVAHPTDLAVATAIASGDREAFRTLMQRHHRLLGRTARSIVKGELDVEDVVQNAFLVAYRNISSFDGGSALSTWLVRIVINEALASGRKS